MDYNLMEALELLEREQGVSKDTILDALANALVSAYKRTPGAAEEARVTIDADTGEINVYAQDLDEDGNVVNEWNAYSLTLTADDTAEEFGRIAAQTAKQVIQQRLRDAKREQVFELYEGREGDLVTGIVQQSDHRYAILDLGNAEAIMPSSERIPYERLDRGNRVKAYILEVRGEGKGHQIVVSRSHPEFIRSLFELEVPELVEGVVEIKAIAREPGHRTKIAVASNDPNVDPVGACVGARGSRVRQVVNELRGEKVDIVEWRDDLQQFIAEALSPARVKEVRLDDEGMIAEVIVPDHQLSLAIGKEGQNARLAARLTGYKIDIRSLSQDLGLDEEVEEGDTAEAAPAEGPTADETTTPAPAADGGVDATSDEPDPSAAAMEAPAPADAAVEAMPGDEGPSQEAAAPAEAAAAEAAAPAEAAAAEAAAAEAGAPAEAPAAEEETAEAPEATEPATTDVGTDDDGDGGEEE